MSKSSRTRVAVFTGSDLRSFGGGEKDVVGWVNNVKGFDLTIYSLLDKSNQRMTFEQIRNLVSPGIDIVYYKAYRVKFLRDIIPASLSGIRALWSLREFKTVYSMHQGLIINAVILFLCKTFGIKYIFGVHSPIFFDDSPIENTLSKRILMKLFNTLRNYLVKNMGFIRIQNNSDKRNVLGKGFSGKIYNIPPHVFDDSVRVDVTRIPEKFIAIFVGRLSIRHKGLDLLAKIVDRVMETEKGIAFHVVGSGKEGEPIMSELSNKYPENFIWKGFLSEEELEEEFNASSLFLSPSRGENFGISLGEAQVHGLPAVAFRVMGAEDIMTNKEQGALVEPFDTNSFAGSVIEYYGKWKSDPASYAEMKKAISALIRNKFGDEKMISGLEVMLSPQDV